MQQIIATETIRQ